MAPLSTSGSFDGRGRNEEEEEEEEEKGVSLAPAWEAGCPLSASCGLPLLSLPTLLFAISDIWLSALDVY